MIDLPKTTTVTEAKEHESEGISALLNRDIKLFKPSFSDRRKERFYSELHTLLVAGPARRFGILSCRQPVRRVPN